MLRLTEIKLPLKKYTDDDLRAAIIERLAIEPEELLGFTVFRRGHDARKKSNILFVFTLDVALQDESGVLARLLAVDHARRKAVSVGKSGATSLSKLRGRPMEARPGNPREGRLALVATLRAAAPWQRLRARADGRLSVQADDLRITRFKQKRGTTTVFIVDASGSQAAQRLAEVKGAIERLLADCYVRRDSIALVAFRGKTAEIILPPTRSIARARRTLAGLPGGGGTPLASGLALGLEVAERIQRKGETALIVLMTDGRANIARDGSPGREKAGAEALDAAKLVRLSGVRALTIDSSAPSRRGEAKPLAEAMQGLYLPLPFADAGAIDRAVRAAARP